MARTRRLKAILQAEDRASATFSRVTKTLGVLGATAVAVGTVQLGRKLVQGMKAAVAAAAVQEKAEVSLAAAIRTTGESAAEALPKYKEYAAGLQDITGIGDEVILQNQSMLVSLGRLRGEGLQRATEAALDLSAAMGVSQRTAFDLLAKAATGYTSTLSRYGIILDEAIPATEKFGAALDLIEEKFGGAAAAQLDTYAGRLGELQGRFGDLQEVIGGPVSTVFREFFGNVLSPAIKDMTTAADESEGFRIAILDMGIALASVGVVLSNVGGSLVAADQTEH